MSASPSRESVSQGGNRLRLAFGVGGLIAALLGLFIIFFPVESGAATMGIVAVVIGVYALIVGAVYIGTALFSKGVSGWARTGPILLGVLYLIGAIVVFVNVGIAAAVLAVFLSVTIGLLWLFEGIMAFVGMNHGGNKVWHIIYGIISIIAGLSLVISPLVGAVTLWWLVGISLVVLGVVQMVRAFQARTAA